MGGPALARGQRRDGTAALGPRRAEGDRRKAKRRDFVPGDGAERDPAVGLEKQVFERPVSVERNLDPPLYAPVRHGVVAMGVDRAAQAA